MTAGCTPKKTASAGKDANAVSVLISLLVFTRYAIVFIFITVLGTALRLPFFPLRIGGDPADADAQWPTAYIGAAVRPDMTDAALYTQSATEIVLLIGGFFIVTQMLNVLRNVSAGHAFVRENGGRLRRMGYAGVVIQLSIYAIWAIAQAVDLSGAAEVDGLMMEISPAPWIVILCAFALSTVFNDAATLKEEQELTV